MKRLALLFLFAMPLHAGWWTRHHVLNISEGLACAESAVDAWTTYKVTSIGGHEANPFLVVPGTNGRVNWPLLIGYKALVCAAPYALDLLAHRVSSQEKIADTAALTTSTASNISFGLIDVSNLHQLTIQRRLNAALAGQK